MNEVSFLETTALVDLNFKSKLTRAKVAGACFDRRITSRYAVFELARGYLRNLILLHNKGRTSTGFSQLFNYVNKIRMRAHTAGTIIEAFQFYFEDGFARGLIKLPSGMRQDEAMLRQFLGWLRKQIRYNWMQIPSSVGDILNSVGCRDPVENPVIDAKGLYQQKLDKQLCGIASACGLSAYVSSHRVQFAKLKDELSRSGQPDIETQNRLVALRELARSRDFKRNSCYRVGDAVLVSETPNDATIVSSNRKHIEPIAASLGKKASFY